MTDRIKDRILHHDLAVPRYTSYPTTPHFQAAEGDAMHREWLAALPPGHDVSLYFHIPFCPKLCWFCGCHTKVTQRYAPVQDYLRQLRREVALVSAALPHGPRVCHVHFGGGSPSMLAHDDFSEFMALVRDSFDIAPDTEIAVEIDPRQASEVKIAAYARSGVNRVSFGVQDFNEKVLKSVNRQQPFFCTFEAMKACRDYGIASVNMDFMYGLPHQDTDSVRYTMECAAALKPDRISLFGYAHVPWMKKHMRLIPEKALPRAADRYDLFAVSSQILEDSGYNAIGIDHFARTGDNLSIAQKQGRLRRNFQGYTSDKADTLIGMGISAISKLPQGYIQNSPHTPQYYESVADGRLPSAKYFMLSREDRLRAAVIERLMCDGIVDIGMLCGQYDYPPSFLDASIEGLAPYIDDGLVTVAGERSVRVLHRHAVRLACTAFDGYIAPAGGAPRHTQAV